MVDRLRFLLDRPLDPSAARAILVLASAILLGLAALFALAAADPDRPTSQESRPQVTAPPAPAAPAQAIGADRAERLPPIHRQDPQDVPGSAAARRAARALRSHRALQHVPYRDGRVRIALVGARGSRAILRVSAPSRAAARRGWREFLRRYRDEGRAYLPRFRATRGREAARARSGAPTTRAGGGA